MAYQIRQKDPLLDSTMQAALSRRTREIVGVVLCAVAVALSLMLVSYSPDDPSILAATELEPRNILGRFGATVSMVLFMIVGLGAWAFALALAVWGARLITHNGADRAWGRGLFVPPWIAMAAIYASTHSPGQNWGQESIGLGGLFGDTALGLMLALLPIGNIAALKLLSLIMFFAMLALGAFALGIDKAEAKQLRLFLLGGIVILLKLTQSGAAFAGRTAHTIRERKPAQSVADPVSPFDATPERVDDWTPEPLALPGEPEPVKRSIFGKLARRAEPEGEADMLTDAELLEIHEDSDGEPEERIQSRIASAIKSRVARGEPVTPPATKVIRNAALPEPDLATEVLADTALDDVEEVHAEDQEPVYVQPERVQDLAAEPSQPKSEPTLQAPQRILAPAPQMVSDASPEVDVPPVATRAPLAPPPMERPNVTPPLMAPQPSFRASPQIAEPARAEPVFRAEPQLSATRIEPPISLRTAAPEPRGTTLGTMVEDTSDPYADEDYQALPEPVDGPAVIQTPTVVTAPALHRKVQHPKKTADRLSRQAKAEAQPKFMFDEAGAVEYELPPLSLLASPRVIARHHLSDEALEENARMLETVLDDYGVKGEIVSVRPGPVVTMYELEPAPGLKASRVIGLADDIARSMSALSARVSTVPGRSVIGIELPNENREMVLLRELLSHREFGDTTMRLPLALGKDIGGTPIVANLAKMPHLLIAGTTGSGKSVAINTMILSLLYKLTPEECRLIMIDPKMLELSVYDGIPHLLSPVVTDPKKAVVALKWVVGEMEERYRKMSKMGVRNIEGYNGRVQDALNKGEMFSRTMQTGFDDETGEPVFETEEIAPVKLPYIVVIVDEMADLMMVAGKEIEACIQRLAQMARASGIHLVMATQRPSVDVITGTIKANFPTRISFHVTSKVDSRTILGEQGAEQLLGMGDMLYMAGGSKITRVHGPFCSDEEVEEIVNHLKSFGPPEYASSVLDGPDEEKASNIDQVLGLGGNTTGEDALYDQAVAIVAKDRKCSTSYIQRKLGIGYNKAARLVEQMEEEGLVSPSNHVGKREILLPEPT